MNLLDMIQRRLIFVTGKGGVGKTCLASSIGTLSSDMGIKTIIVEVDNFHPTLPSIFQKSTDYTPVQVKENLFMCNITWKRSLEDWLYRTIKLKRIVQLIQSHKIAMLFLDATPGAREIVLLSKIIELLDKYEKVIVDLPASGHALGILRVPRTATKLMRTGPINERAKQILKVFSSPKTELVLSSLPEEMVVNETLEFRQKLKTEIPEFQNIRIFLNRTATPSLSEAEIELLNRLQDVSDNDSRLSDVLQAGVWEQDLERATTVARYRLRKELGEDVFSFSRFGLLGGFEGGMPKVVRQMTSALNRQVQKEATK